MKQVNGVTFIVMMTIIISFPNAVQSVYAAPGTGTLYGVASGPGVSSLVTINPLTGAVTSVPLAILDDNGTPGNQGDDFIIASGIPALALDPTSGILYLGTGTGVPAIYILNPLTGEASFQCNLASANPSILAIEALAFDSFGNLFASVNTLGGGNGGTDFVEIDTLCNISNGPIPFGFGGMGGMAFNAADNLYGSTTGPNGQLYTINTGTGSPTAVGPFDQSGGIPITLTGGVASLQFDCTGTLLGGTGRGGLTGLGVSDLVTINTVSGAANVIGAGTIIGSTLGALAYDQSCSIGVGGELLSVNTAALLVAGIQTSFSWIIALAASIAGIGTFVIRKKLI